MEEQLSQCLSGIVEHVGDNGHETVPRLGREGLQASLHWRKEGDGGAMQCIVIHTPQHQQQTYWSKTHQMCHHSLLFGYPCVTARSLWSHWSGNTPEWMTSHAAYYKGAGKRVEDFRSAVLLHAHTRSHALPLSCMHAWAVGQQFFVVSQDCNFISSHIRRRRRSVSTQQVIIILLHSTKCKDIQWVTLHYIKWKASTTKEGWTIILFSTNVGN